MSATARAPRPDDDVPRPAAVRPRAARTGPRAGAARPASARAAAPARPAPRSAPAPAESPAAPVRGRAHTAPVRAGALRARPSRPVPRPAPVPAAPAAPAAGEPRRRSLPGLGTARRTPFVLLVVGLLVGTTLALLFLNTAIAVNSLKATELRSENTQRAQRLEQLEQQVVAAGTPGVMAAAAAAAGLVQADTAGYLVIGPDGSVTLRGTPEPAEAPPAPPAAGD
ncbi:hypothetical protein [Blastococcus sp. SYSU D00813]